MALCPAPGCPLGDKKRILLRETARDRRPVGDLEYPCPGRGSMGFGRRSEASSKSKRAARLEGEARARDRLDAICCRLGERAGQGRRREGPNCLGTGLVSGVAQGPGTNGIPHPTSLR
jgi:hypothetical protein